MTNLAEELLNMCLSFGILTQEPIRKYPLRPSNLAAVLKALAVATNKPYKINLHRLGELFKTPYYLTEGGLEWLTYTFQSKSLEHNRCVYQFVFSKATEQDLHNLSQYEGMHNFMGIVGEQPKAGTKQAAVLVRSYGKDNKIKKEYPFNTLKEAREELFNLLRYYPATEFTLYRIRKLMKNGKETHYREQVPLVLEPRPVTLPYVRGDK